MSLKRGFALLAVVIALPYARPPVYRFPDARPFSGASFFNPYADDHVVWSRGNLHAHGRAWSGVTNGRQPSPEIVERYRNRGYAIAAVSNYQQIAAGESVEGLPVYEHGYNIDKRHQLAVGARAVEWFDLPLWQFVGDEQFIINRVKAKADLVALAHPATRDAYSADELRQLTGYDLFEVANGPFVAEDLWDAALSAGRLVWAIADDDSHDLNDARRSSVAWNMIGASSTSTPDVIAALKAGRTFAVMRTDEDPAPVEAVVPHVTFSDGTIVVTSGEPSEFIFIGQNGQVRQSIQKVTEASYTFKPDDAYIRTVVRSPRTATFINPIIRSDGRVPDLAATEDVSGTWIKRGAFLLMAAVLLAVTFRRRRSPARAARPVIVTNRFRKRA